VTKIFPVFIKRVTQGGGGPNPADAFSLKLIFPDTNLAPVDAVSFAFTFPDTNVAPVDALTLGFVFADSNLAPVDSLSKLGIIAGDTIPAQIDAATFLLRATYNESNLAPVDAASLAFTVPDSIPAQSDSVNGDARVWLTGSTNTSQTTNPGNADGSTPEGGGGAVAVIQTALLGATTAVMTSQIGTGIPANAHFTTATFRAWFSVATTLVTSVVTITLHSSSALFADIVLFTFSGVAGNVPHLTGDFTFPLSLTLAQLRSATVVFQTSDAAAGVTPAVLSVDAARIELTNVL